MFSWYCISVVLWLLFVYATTLRDKSRQAVRLRQHVASTLLWPLTAIIAFAYGVKKYLEIRRNRD